MEKVFNEQTLREEIANTWGEHGAHMAVYDRLLKELSSIKAVETPKAPTDEEIKSYLRETYRIIRREELATITEIAKGCISHFNSKLTPPTLQGDNPKR